jgi:hypothetical protein
MIAARLMMSAMVRMYKNTFLAVSKKKHVRTASDAQLGLDECTGESQNTSTIHVAPRFKCLS